MIRFHLFLMFSLISSNVFADDVSFSHSFSKGSPQSSKIRRGGTAGLYPFPRVGRSQLGKSWLLPPKNYEEYHPGLKRQGLMPFPRVGRSMYPFLPFSHWRDAIEGGKRSLQENMKDDKNGMWFGPRLGRVSKKNIPFDDNVNNPWTMIALREIASSGDFTPRLGRELEENLELEDGLIQDLQVEPQPQENELQALPQ